MTHEQKLQEIINNITKTNSGTPKDKRPSETPQPSAEDTPKEKKEEKWRSYPVDKQKKIYKNTVNLLDPPADLL